jgi:large subunit ribosomal protein L4
MASRTIEPSDLKLTADYRAEVSPLSFATYIRSLMQNWRQGTVASKTRGEVSFSTKKPWKQKGTGRARAGTRRSPLWRKGGTIFGPQPRVRKLKVSQDIRKKVLNALLWQQLEQQKIVALEAAFSGDVFKTADAFKFLKDAGLHSKKVTLFVNTGDYGIHGAFTNIPNVRLILFDQPNAYVLAHSDYWVYLTKDAEAFKKMVNAWI